MKNLLTIVALILQFSIWSQTPSYKKADVIEDLQYLDKAVAKHAINYKRPIKISLQNFIDSCEKALSEQLAWNKQLIYRIDKTPKNRALKPNFEVEYALEDIIKGVDKDLKKAMDFVEK
jgi:hypothetical protein